MLAVPVPAKVHIAGVLVGLRVANHVQAQGAPCNLDAPVHVAHPACRRQDDRYR